VDPVSYPEPFGQAIGHAAQRSAQLASAEDSHSWMIYPQRWPRRVGLE